MSKDKPRKAYCTGCGVTFEKKHLLRNHRNTFRCGGRFLSEAEMLVLNKLRFEREALLRRERMFDKLEDDHVHRRY